VWWRGEPDLCFAIALIGGVVDWQLRCRVSLRSLPIASAVIRRGGVVALADLTASLRCLSLKSAIAHGSYNSYAY